MDAIKDGMLAAAKAAEAAARLGDSLFGGRAMKFKSQICTSREQSERLLALGLKKETADMHWYKPSVYGNDDWYIGVGLEWGSRDIPAWSLHRLLCLYNVHYLEFMGEKEIAGAYDIVIDAITQAIEGGYFNEKYLV